MYSGSVRNFLHEPKFLRPSTSSRRAKKTDCCKRWQAVEEDRPVIATADEGELAAAPGARRIVSALGCLEIWLINGRSVVRHALARAVSAIADLELTVNPPQWPDLLPGLYQAAKAPQPAQREIALYVLFSLLETVADTFETEVKHLFQLFTETLLDPQSSEVRITTLRSLAKVAEYISTDDKHDIRAFQELIVPMLNVTQQAVKDGDDEGVKHAFDVWETLLIIETPLVSKHVGEMTSFFMGVSADKEVDESMRCGALNVLSWIIR